MFERSAEYYDLLYERGLGKDYAAEAAMVADLLPDAQTLLDVACGTGLHLQHLAARFDCEGVDLDPGMLSIARTRCPSVPLAVADMADLDLGRRFDAIVCLFSSIGYVGTEARLRRTAASFAAHLEPGGTVIVEPWLTPDGWTEGHTGLLTVSEPDVKIARVNRSVLEDGCSVMEFHYVVATPDAVTHEVERHVLGLFTWDQYRDAFEGAGFDVTIQVDGGPMGRGLLTGHT